MKNNIKEMFVNLGFLVGINWNNLSREEMEEFADIFEKDTDYKTIIDKLYSDLSIPNIVIDKDELLKSIEEYKNAGNNEMNESQELFFNMGKSFGYVGTADKIVDTAKVLKEKDDKDDKDILEELLNNVPSTLLKKKEKVQLITETSKRMKKKEELNEEDKVFNSYMEIWRQKLKEKM